MVAQVKPRCPRCESISTYYRTKTQDHVCRICGNVWNRARTDISSGGQNTDTIRAAFSDDARVVRLCELWDRWHLNDMRPGMRAQAAYLADQGLTGAKYEAAVKALEAANLLEVRTPDGKFYKYGSAWLVEPLPAEVEAEVRELVAALKAEPARMGDRRDFCERHGIRAVAHRVDSNPNMDDDGRVPMDHWRVTLKRGRARMTLPYSKGIGHEGKAPTALEVLGCLVSDATDDTFEDWCANYGMETDSRKAERTYKACVRQTAKLRKFMGELYDELMEEIE